MATALEVDLDDLSRKRNVIENFEEGVSSGKLIFDNNVKINSKVVIEVTIKLNFPALKVADNTNEVRIFELA